MKFRLVLSVAGLLPVPALAGSYKYITLDFPYAQIVYVTGINNKGQVIGTWRDGSGIYHGFLWQNGQLQTLEPPLATSGSPDGINDAGTIVGDYMSLAGGSQGYILKNGVFTPVGRANYLVSLSSINNHGESLGYAQHFVSKPYKVDQFTVQAGGLTHVRLVGQSAQGYAINDQGTIIGTYIKNYANHAFAYNNGILHDINVPSSTYTAPAAINASGTIVGFYYEASYNYGSFINQGGAITTVQYPNLSNTFFYGLNNAGQIVGYATNDSGTNVGFVYQGGTFQTIAVPGSGLTEPDVINDKGMIAGTYYPPPGTVAQAFIAIPQ